MRHTAWCVLTQDGRENCFAEVTSSASYESMKRLVEGSGVGCSLIKDATCRRDSCTDWLCDCKGLCICIAGSNSGSCGQLTLSQWQQDGSCHTSVLISIFLVETLHCRGVAGVVVWSSSLRYIAVVFQVGACTYNLTDSLRTHASPRAQGFCQLNQYASILLCAQWSFIVEQWRDMVVCFMNVRPWCQRQHMSCEAIVGIIVVKISETSLEGFRPGATCLLVVRGSFDLQQSYAIMDR